MLQHIHDLWQVVVYQKIDPIAVHRHSNNKNTCPAFHTMWLRLSPHPFGFGGGGVEVTLAAYFCCVCMPLINVPSFI